MKKGIFLTALMKVCLFAATGEVFAADGFVVHASNLRENGGHFYSYLTRYLMDGSLDLSFGDSGKVSLGDIDLMKQEPQSMGSYVAEQNDKIIVAGQVMAPGELHFFVQRYLPNGTLDSTFGISGTTSIPIAKDKPASLQNVRVLDNQEIILVGDLAGDFLVVRLDAAGKVKTGFGENGIVTIDFAGKRDTARSALRFPDGRLLVAGIAVVKDLNVFGMALLQSDGTLSKDFGDGGLLMKAVGEANSSAYDLVGTPSGFIATGSSRDESWNHNIGLVKFDWQGNLDPSFGKGGMVNTHLPSIDVTSGGQFAMLTPDGKIVTLSRVFRCSNEERPCRQGYTWGMAIARFHSNGELDTSFGDAGGYTHSVFGANPKAGGHPTGLQRHSNGHFIAVGTVSQGYHHNQAVAVYLPDGRPEPTFGEKGEVIGSFAPGRK